MKLSAVVVWYNPQNENVENIKTYTQFVDKVYIVDNSLVDNTNLVNGLNKIEYIPLFNNEGIAKALNIGCQKALSEGFSWCMTMDQDSSWNTNELEKYINEINKTDFSSGYVSFAPSIHLPVSTTSYLGDFKRKLKKTNQFESFENIDVERVICSGNVINIDVWNKVGKFKDSFFIDEVDSEFCYRLLNNGYKIRQICSAKMNHVLGIPKKTLLPRAENHVGVRLYYIARNKLFINKEYPGFSKKYHYVRDIRRIFLQKLLELKFNDMKYIIQGIFAFLWNIEGCYENYITRKD